MAPNTTIVVVSEAVEQLQAHVQAFEAIEQLLSLDRLTSDTHMPGVRRDAFAALLGVVNASLAAHCRQLIAATTPLRTEP